MPNTNAPHLVRAYDQELQSLRQALAHMGGLVENQLAAALSALQGLDAAAARAVIAADDGVDLAEEKINEQVLRLLALRQPVAVDLRTVMGAMKNAAALERVGDYAVSIAKRVKVLEGHGQTIPALRSIITLGGLVLELLHEALDAAMAEDADHAEKVWLRDEEIDALYSSLFRELLTYMMEDPRHITPCTHLIFIAKNLERCGDQATKVAEVTWYTAHGSTLEGQRPKQDTSSDAG